MISLVRVDNRLLHGQVLEAWIPALKICRVVVADEEVASNSLVFSAMSLCLPPGLMAEVLPVAGLSLPELALSKEPTLLLVREVEALVRAQEQGLEASLAPRINVGNVHFAEGRRPVTPSVYLSQEEIRTLSDMAKAGFRIEVAALPTEHPVGIAEIERRYAAGR